MSDDARYILSKKIARGGMAEIYLGKHVGEDGFQRLCAIKRILPHYAQDQEFIQMFRDEAHICKRLQHANIVRVEGFEEVEGSYAIIMEFVDGADLRTLLHSTEQAKKRMPIPMACYVVAEAARGLHYAHTKVDEITQQPLGIVHRDISPQNVLLSYEGEIKITDFGIADSDSKLTETRPGIVKGKYSYMSPEQISAKAVDARTDVFALAIVLWEMLSMRRLFQGENEVDTIQRVKACKIDLELRDLNSEVDEELDTIIKKGLAKDPKRRYKTAADFEKDLRRFMSRKYPDFTPEDLGNFLKKSLESRRSESTLDIKKTLTETNLRPTKKKPEGKKRSLDLDVEDVKDLPQLSVSRKTTATSPLNAIRPLGGTSQVGSRPSSSFSRVIVTRSTSVGNSRRNETILGAPRALFLGFVAALALLVGGVVWRELKSEREPELTLRTQPSRVRVTVDDVPFERGRYQRATARAPLRVPLSPGRRKITVSREGYQSFELRLQIKPGESLVRDDIVLKEQSPLAAVKVRARNAEGKVKFDFNDGYFVATLIPGKVAAVAPDLLAGRTYKMEVVLLNEKGFTCRVTPRSTSWRQPTEIVIDVKARKCIVTGP